MTLWQLLAFGLAGGLVLTIIGMAVAFWRQTGIEAREERHLAEQLRRDYQAGHLLRYWASEADRLSGRNAEGIVGFWTTDDRLIQRRAAPVHDQPGLYRVDRSDFTTTDPTLAQAVAAEYDRIDQENQP